MLQAYGLYIMQCWQVQKKKQNATSAKKIIKHVYPKSVFFFFFKLKYILAGIIPWTESVAGYSPWGHKKSVTTGHTHIVDVRCFASFKCISK